MENGIEMVFRPRSTGTLDENGVCHDVRIISFDAIPASDDAFGNMTSLHESSLNQNIL